MKSDTVLPEVKGKKKINLTTLEPLAKKVSKYLREEAEYLREKKRRNEDNNSSELLPGY